MDKITVRPRSNDLKCMLAEFVHANARYHVWFDPATMQLTAPILYKNPLDGVKYRTPGYFDTRRLNATAPKNAALIADVLRIVVKQQMVEAAGAKIHAKNVTESHQRHVTGIVRDWWVAMMRRTDLPNTPTQISDEEFETCSALFAKQLAGE